ncbi:MAG: phosphate ABC transporter substrate-binding protein [Candidatus Methanofastidiosa archaeon]|nr:phosphate ABC transporter substrate-binding protein [Candidatus Methanofastidiosa archaeon]
MKVRYGIMLICILVASLVSGCISGGGNGSDDGLSGTLAIAGSTTVQPIASAAAEVFMDLHPNVIVTIQGGGSGTGVTQAGQGVVDIGNASREVKASEYEAYPDLVATAVAADGIAVVVHPSNAIGTLTVEQIKGIFTGDITNWSQVGGADRTIVLVIREDGSGTRGTFEELVHDKIAPASGSLQKSSNGAVKTTVAQTPDAIGYMGLGYIDESVKALRVNNIIVSEATILNGSYPISRNLYMLTNGAPSGLAKEFIDFILSAEGQEIVAEEGFIKLEGAAPSTLSGTIRIAGSTTVQPIASAAAEAFMGIHQNVTITVQGGGSGTGVTQAGQGVVDIGNASREVKASEYDTYPDLVATAVAADGIAVIVHPSNQVTALTPEQVKGIFTGEITNWSQVGGADRTIVVVIREDGSGTRATFEELVHNKIASAAGALQKASNGAVKTTVAQTPDAIGYCGIGYVDSSISAVTVGGVLPSETTILNGSYPISRNLYMLTNGEPSGLVKAFIDFILSDAGQDIVAEEGFIRL